MQVLLPAFDNTRTLLQSLPLDLRGTMPMALPDPVSCGSSETTFTYFPLLFDTSAKPEHKSDSCFRCGGKGHWKNECPQKDNPNFIREEEGRMEQHVRVR